VGADWLSRLGRLGRLGQRRRSLEFALPSIRALFQIRVPVAEVTAGQAVLLADSILAVTLHHDVALGHGILPDPVLALRPHGPPPHPGGDDHLVLLRKRGHPAPGPRLAQVTQLGGGQLGQPFTLQHRPGGEPGEYGGGQYVEPEQGMAERETKNGQDHHVRDGNSREHRDLAERKRHGQPKIVELVKPFLDAPDIGVGGQVHRERSPSLSAS
jgi:hypothetical protein